MILTDTQILELCEHPVNEVAIKAARDLQDVHKVHVTGEKYKDYIKQIIGKENYKDYAQKKELAEPVTTSITKRVIDEQSRWQNAGAKRFYEWVGGDKSKDFKEKILSQVWKSESMEYFIKNFLRDSLYTEFNGFVIVEQGKVETLKDGTIVETRDGVVSVVEDKKVKPYIIFRPIDMIKDFDSSGNKVEYIIIDWGYKDKDEKIKLWRVIDDQWDTIVEQEGEGYTISTTFPKIPNELGFVPVLQISTRLQSPICDEVKTSYIRQTIPLLKTYLKQWAEHVITCILHSHPIFYQLGQRCEWEDEDGKCDNGEISWLDVKGSPQVKSCPSCKGKGASVNKDPSAAILLPQVDETGQPYSIANVAGYITPPVEALTEQRDELNWLEDKIYRTGTGMDRMAETQIEKTATEAMINYKPLEEIIGEIIDNIEYLERNLTDIIGKLYYKSSFKRSSIVYNRSLNLRDENTVLQEIEQAKNAGASASYVRTLHNELIHSRYLHSPIDLERNLILSELEPFIGYTPEELNKYFAGFVDTDTMIFKVYFTDYVVRFENDYTLITDYKEGLTLSDRVKDIKVQLLKYNSEMSVRVKKDMEANAESTGDPPDSL